MYVYIKWSSDVKLELKGLTDITDIAHNGISNTALTIRGAVVARSLFDSSLKAEIAQVHQISFCP